MKSKRFVIMFRILLILTFIAGMVYLISFVSLAESPATSTSDEFLAACRRWTYIFFVYLLMCVGSAVLSIVGFRTTKKLTSVVRTVIIGFAAVADLLSVRYIAVFRGYDDAVEAAKEIDGLLEKGTLFIIMSFVGAMLLFSLMVSSVYYIIRVSRTDEFDAVLEPEKEKPAKAEKQ